VSSEPIVQYNAVHRPGQYTYVSVLTGGNAPETMNLLSSSVFTPTFLSARDLVCSTGPEKLTADFNHDIG
jgi:hypothetical protein